LISQIPNLISVFRLCLVPVVLRLIWTREYEWALLWCAIAGASDAVDGFLARRLRATSRAGAYLDPSADKLLLSGAYFVFGYNRVIPWWVTAVVFGRDAIMLLFFAVAFSFTPLRQFPPTVWGKLSTVIQIFTALAILLMGIVSLGPSEYTVRNVFLGVTVAATLWSAIDYFRIGAGMLVRSRFGQRSAKFPN
jgi:cardiolipin synthase (CMP-forming)